LPEVTEQAAAATRAEFARGFDGRPRNAMSVDVEEHFQVSAFASTTERADWEDRESRVERNIDAILALFAEHQARATFFTLGWIAERHPSMIRRIVDGGHEIASHGYQHVQVFDQSPDQFRADVRRTRAVLEDISSTSVRGYRAASFSIDARTLWAFEILAEEGHEYSSSIYPIRHDLYGMPNAPRFAFRPERAKGLIEVPVTTVKVFGHNMPCGGGGYFRLLPQVYSRWAMRRVNRNDRQSCVFYFHPWEIDPGQPRMPGLPFKSRFRHYTNLGRMEPRLRRVLREFAWDRMDRVFLGDGSEI
jgi:polysaccharide deacetylase family protein (PEP-CTERM system associated)